MCLARICPACTVHQTLCLVLVVPPVLCLGGTASVDSWGGACDLTSSFLTGQLLSFDIGDQPVFEIPLSNVSQCTTGKNEVTLEFHQNDDAEVSLMEVRFYVPPTQEDGVDPVEVRLLYIGLLDIAEYTLAGWPGSRGWLFEYPCVFTGLCPECPVKGRCDPSHWRCHLHLPGAAVFDSSWSLRYPDLPYLSTPAWQNL